MYVSHFLKLSCFFFFFKALQVIIVLQVNVQFDTSSQILLDQPSVIAAKAEFINYFAQYNIPGILIETVLTKFVERLVIWDAVYFSRFFSDYPKYEHEWVFGPLWWRMVRYFPLVDLKDNFYSRFILGVVLANVSHYLSMLFLYALTNVTFASTTLKHKQKGGQLAIKTALLYVINPAGIFLTAPYSESAGNLLSFVGLYLRQVSLKHTPSKITKFKSPLYSIIYVLSGFFVAAAILTRSNLVLVAYVYLYDFLYFGFHSKVLSSLVAFLTGFTTFLGLILLNYLPYNEFCPERAVWCAKKAPSLYLFAQSHYWNNGFLKYWTLNNVPNFLLALPIVTTLLFSLMHFKAKYYIPSLVPYFHITALFLFLGITSWHVQILTRIGGFIPLPYWYLADKLIESNRRDKLVGKVFKKQGKKLSSEYVTIGWFFTYSLVQTALFAGFLPPA